MNLSLKGFSQLVEDMGAALQSSATKLVDISVGSVTRALFEANASVVLWLQWLILRVLQTTRAATATGSDLDSWMLDFGLIRLPATASTGVVTFSRFVSNLPATVVPGTLVKTTDGSTSFQVVADSTISIWQPGLGAYVIPAGVLSADLPVLCTTGGATGNVLASTVTLVAASLSGIDEVNNANPFGNGSDAEPDAALRKRFQTYLDSRSRATLMAVQDAIANVRQGLEFVIDENTGAVRQPQTGNFLVTLDDGSGYPAADLISAVASAVDAVRPIGTTFSVVPPTVVVIDVSLTATFTVPATTEQVVANIQNAVANYLNSLGIGRMASVTRVAQAAYLVSDSIDNITGVQLNGGSVDIVPPPGTVIKAGLVNVVANGG